MKLIPRWVRRRSLTTLAVTAGTAAVLVSLATGAGPSPSPIPEGCRLRAPQPEAPLTVNAVAVKDLVRTVVMKKEVFECFDATSALVRLRDVETFVHVVERVDSGKTPGVATVAVHADAASCNQELNTGRVTCGTVAVPLGSADAPIKGCSPADSTYPFDRIEQPSHPVEMTTKAVAGLLVTTKVENELLDCAGKIGDLYLFTRIAQDADAPAFTSRGRGFRGILCLTDEVKAEVTQCVVFSPGAA